MVTVASVKIPHLGTMGAAVLSILGPSTITGCHTHKGLRHPPGGTLAELKDNSLLREKIGAGGFLPASSTSCTRHLIERQER